MVPAHSPAIPPPGGVICDLDGTLVATVPTRIKAWLATFAEFGLPADRDHVASLIGSDGKWLAERVAERADRPLAADESEAIDRRAGEIYGELNIDPRPLPGVPAFLAALQEKGIAWAIATSSRPEQVRVSVAALGLDSWPVVVDGLTVARAKPEPDLLLAAAERLSIAAGDCWCVGDSRWDMLAAVAAEMVAIGIDSGAVPASVLRETGALIVVGRPDELIPHLAPGAGSPTRSSAVSS
jgi:HAD superfamily hydrolase (TIGR01509 family)